MASVALSAPGAYKSWWRPSILDGYILRMLGAPAGAVLGVTLVAFLLDQTLHLIDQLASNGAHLGYLFGLVYEWQSYDDPGEMLLHLRGKASPRKLYLFACACVRQVWHLLTDERTCRC